MLTSANTAKINLSRKVGLAVPVDPARNHIRGPAHAAITVVEYGDFECPWTQQAAPAARELLAGHPDLRYVWRHLPLHDVHPHAQLAAEAAEAAAAQGRFWPMHDLLLAHLDRLDFCDLVGYAAGWAWTSTASATIFSGTLMRHTWRRTSTRPTAAASLARRHSSSTGTGTTGHPTSPP
jgi:hypothetical protein